MQIFRLIGAAIVVASISAFSSAAIAAVAPGDLVFDNDAATKLASPAVDCLASFDPSSTVVLVEVNAGCDAVLAEATGLCLAPADRTDLRPVAGAFDPFQGVSCTSIRASPPG